MDKDEMIDRLTDSLYDLATLNVKLLDDLEKLQQAYDALKGKFFNEKPVAYLLREKGT